MTDNPNDGGPAFPIPDPSGANVHAWACGMSLRDYFAGQALTAIDARGSRSDAVAFRAYNIADAMLAARKTGGAS